LALGLLKSATNPRANTARVKKRTAMKPKRRILSIVTHPHIRCDGTVPERRISGPRLRQDGLVSQEDWIGAKRETPESMAYAGLGVAEARDGAGGLGVKMVRVIDGPEDTITFDFREYRLNLFVVDSVVSRAAFF
jgi:hypothetical protein